MKRDEYEKILENGIDHINSAKILAANELYGFAVSHIILGIEELIKYQIVQANSGEELVFNETESDPKNRKSVFRNHNTKHNLLKEFQEAISEEFSELFMNYIFYKTFDGEYDERYKKVEENRFKEVGNFFYVAYSEINIPEVKKEKFFGWLREANNKKNQGFYVDYINERVELPKSISKEDFEEALEYSNYILEQTKVFKEMDLTEDEFIELLSREVEINQRPKKK